MASGIMRAVVVDDTDRDIRYTGEGWFQDSGGHDGLGNYGPTYQHTLHGTNVSGSLTYTFRGTFVRVVGTTNLIKTPAGTFDPSWECFVDNVSIGVTKPFEFAENNWTLCGKSDLADEEHEIVVNVKSAGQTFWFDNIQYTPSPSITLETAVVLIDNQDPGIAFDSQWHALGGNANMTQAAGSTATFLFAGTSVSWVGYIPTELPHNASNATYSIDGGPPIVFLLKGLPPGPTNTVYNQIFFTTPKLTAGPHSLVVVHRGTTQQTPLTLDFLYVTGNTSTLMISPISISTTTNGFTTTLTNISTPITSLMLSSTTTISFATTSTSPAPQLVKDSSPVGVIIGVVIGGVSFISLTLFLLWRYKRRSQHGKPYLSASGERTQSHETVSPFTSLSGSRLGYNAPRIRRDILINPSFQDGLGPQMQRGPVTKPLLYSLISPPLVSAVNQSTGSVVEPGMQRGPVSNPFYPLSPHPIPAASHAQPTSLETPRSAPPTGPSLDPRLHMLLDSNVTQMVPRRELRDHEERILVPHQDSGLRFDGRSVLSSILPVYTET